MKNTNLKYIINLFLIGFTHFTMNATGLSGAAITYQLIDTNQGRYKITL